MGFAFARPSQPTGRWGGQTERETHTHIHTRRHELNTQVRILPACSTATYSPALASTIQTFDWTMRGGGEERREGRRLVRFFLCHMKR